MDLGCRHHSHSAGFGRSFRYAASEQPLRDRFPICLSFILAILAWLLVRPVELTGVILNERNR
jgi:hypothetical protein